MWGARKQVVDLDRNGAKKSWEAIPEAYRGRSMFYTDDWQEYRGVVPKESQSLYRRFDQDGTAGPEINP